MKVVTLAILSVLAILVAVAAVTVPQQSEATGGGEQISQLVIPIIDRAIAALEAGNTELALEELETAKNELKDSFEVEE